MAVQVKLQRFISLLEAPTPAFPHRAELFLALAMLPLSFLYKMLDLQFGKNAIAAGPTLYLVIVSLFTAFAFCSLFFLATSWGNRWVNSCLQKGRSHLLASIPAATLVLFFAVLWTLQLPELFTHALARIPSFCLSVPWPLLVASAALVLFCSLYAGIRTSIRFSSPNRRFTFRQFTITLLSVLPFLLLQDFLPIVWCFSTPAAVIVLVFSSGLGRSHFNFSFVPRSWVEVEQAVLLIAVGLVLFLLFAQFAGSVVYTGGIFRAPAVELFDSVFVWVFIVGISEEIIFRCGLLTFVADAFARNSSNSWFSSYPRLSAILLISLLFGLSHLFRGMTLFFLSILASLLYGLSFALGKNLFGPVLLHGILNVLVMMNFSFTDFR